MKRDMDLIREVLLEVEKVEGWDDWKDIKIEGHTPEETSYHVLLLDSICKPQLLIGGGKKEEKPARKR